jgi:glycerol-3-phosphate acyltransferase PlsX
MSEGLIDVIKQMLKQSLTSTITRQVGAVLARNGFDEFRRRTDYSEYGGAPLLGVRGVTIICHGRSNANAIKNAIRVAAEYAAGRVNEKIEEGLSAVSESTSHAHPSN